MKRNFIIFLIFLLFGIIEAISFSFSSSCKIDVSHTDTLYIAFSKASGSDNYLQYTKWIKHFDSAIVCVDMINKTPEEAAKLLAKCSGLVLTGGPDVDPARYGKAGDSSRCDLDRKRDTLEFALIKKALELKMPMLAICRGEQILNVAMGGSLIIDIPADHDTLIHHQTKEKTQIKHYVNLIPGTLLSRLCGIAGDTANSNHHQAVDKLADCFKVSAYAKDSIAEAYEWKFPQGKPFLIAVQWHPEKPDQSGPLATPIGIYFLYEAMKYHVSQNKK